MRLKEDGLFTVSQYMGATKKIRNPKATYVNKGFFLQTRKNKFTPNLGRLPKKLKPQEVQSIVYRIKIVKESHILPRVKPKMHKRPKSSYFYTK